MPPQKRTGAMTCLASLVLMVMFCFSSPSQYVSQTAQNSPGSSQTNNLNGQGLYTLSLKDCLSSLGGFVASVALIIGVCQYRTTQKWKRAEFVAKQIKEFEDDPAVKNVMLMLDWNERGINLSEKYPNTVVTEKLLCICLVCGDLDALRTELISLKSSQNLTDENSQQFTDEEAIVRDAFSKFFDYLERFENFIEAKLVTKEEFEPYLRYWLKVIGKYEGQIKSQVFYKYLWGFIDFYEYSDVQDLFKRYNYDIKPEQREK